MPPVRPRRSSEPAGAARAWLPSWRTGARSQTTVTRQHTTDTSGRSGPRRGLENTASLHRLLSLPGIGHVAAAKIAARHDTWEEFVASDPGDVPDRSSLKAAQLLRVAADAPEPVLPPGVRAISMFDDDWPAWLGFPGAPVVVFCRGPLPPGGGIAVVGTRNPTGFGARAVRACIETILDRVPDTFTGVVSGLARGVDTLAHNAALVAGIPTWAILGSGVDVPTPSVNVALAERILEAGGGLLSEQVPGTEPNKGTLIARNRLQVAASSRVFIAECGLPSGTLHTARYAVEQDRKLIVARPTSARDNASTTTEGNRRLLDPQGCNPSDLGASGATAERIRSRRPVADASMPV